MAINPYFTESGGVTAQKSLYEDLIIEALKIYGQTFHYIPREVLNHDKLFGEDQLARFDDAYEIEMYIETDDFGAGSDLFQKFGVEIRDEATVVVSKSRWFQEVVTTGGETLTRPREGDLVYFNSGKALFEITFVEHEKPFYQLNNLPVYKLNISLFEYSGEEMDLEAIGVDEKEYASTYVVTVADAAGYTDGETVTQTVGTTTVTGEIQSISGNEITVSNVSNDTSSFIIFSAGSDLVGVTSSTASNVTAVAALEDRYSDNNEIESEASTITAFDANNPFGDF